ncbi:MAG: EamA family transporter [Bauldia sp.]|nr:EamA family transporter [Bauldia sp.]
MASTEPVPPMLAAVAPPTAAELRRQVQIGYLLAAAGAVLWSTKGIFIKLAYAEGVDATTLLALRLGLSLPVYLVIGAFSLRDRHRDGRGLPSARAIAMTAFVGFLGYYVASYTDFLGLQYISAQFERMILFTFPLFVVIFGALWFGQKVQPMGLVAIGVSYAGIAVMFAGRAGGGEGSDVVVGTLWVLAAAIAFAFYQLLAKPLIAEVGPRLFTCIAMGAAAVVALGQFVVTHPLSDLAVSGAAWGYAIMLAIGATVIPSFLLAAALHRITPQANSTIGMVSPVVTIGLAWLILGETLTLVDAAGALLVLAGVGWMALQDSRR